MTWHLRREGFNKKNCRTICVANYFTGFYMLQIFTEHKHMFQKVYLCGMMYYQCSSPLQNKSLIQQLNCNGLLPKKGENKKFRASKIYKGANQLDSVDMMGLGQVMEWQKLVYMCFFESIVILRVATFDVCKGGYPHVKAN